MGRILLAYRKQDEDLFKVTCDNAINRLLLQMDGESQGENALRGGYQSVLGLHIVKEVQHAQELLHRCVVCGSQKGGGVLFIITLNFKYSTNAL